VTHKYPEDPPPQIPFWQQVLMLLVSVGGSFGLLWWLARAGMFG
jgi:hypothetical protein